MAKAITEPLSGMRDFLPLDVLRRNYVVSVIQRVYQQYGFEPLETPDDGAAEHAAGQVRRRRRPTHLPRAQARRKAGQGAGRTADRELGGRRRYALRPDGAAGARDGRVPQQAAALLQALPDPARLPRRPPGQGPFPRVLPVRRGHRRLQEPDGRGRGAGRRRPGAGRAGLSRPRRPLPCASTTAASCAG